LLNEWAYERIYGSSRDRAAALSLFLERHNFRGAQRQAGSYRGSHTAHCTPGGLRSA
jgi:hypothetical protein